MGFVEAIQSGFRNYVNFSGRASRSEFWYWVLFGFLLGVAAAVVDAILHTQTQAGGIVNNLIGLALFLPGLAVAVRRLHDTDRTGWWYLLVFTIIGIIPLIIWFCSAGTPYANRFGENPLGGMGLPLPGDPRRVDTPTRM